ncbi:MAG: hypothetical protein U1E67_12190 [Hyphomicrobiales bacterium]
MTAATAALYDGRAICDVPNAPAELGLSDCELTSDEFSRLLGEIDRLQLRSLLDQCKSNELIGRAS